MSESLILIVIIIAGILLMFTMLVLVVFVTSLVRYAVHSMSICFILLRLSTGLLGLLNYDYLRWIDSAVQYAYIDGHCNGGLICGFTTLDLGTAASRTGWNIGAFK